MITQMLISYLLGSFKKYIPFTENSMPSIPYSVIFMSILSLVCLIIGKCFLAFSLYEFMQHSSEFTNIESALIVAVTFSVFGIFVLMYAHHHVKKIMNDNAIISAYGSSKRILDSFLRGFRNRY